MTEKLKMEQNPLSVTVEKIKEICPAAVTSEGKIDFEELKTALSDDVAADAIEKYEFTWVGKNAAKAEANRPIRKTLRPVVADSKNWDTTKNLYIEGDNLDALKLLQESYLGKVKMIYIDPPYNTGNDFVYCDEFAVGCEEYLDKKGQCDSDGNRLFKNTETNGRFHSDWCSMMYPRLKIARDLLSDDGVIFMSIDEHEVVNLKKICDELFNECNYLGQITVVSNPRGRDYGGIAKMHDYILVYRKTQNASLNLVTDKNNVFKSFDELGGFELRELRNRNIKFNNQNRPNLYYPFYINKDEKDENNLYTISIEPKDGWLELYPSESQGVKTVWRWGKDKALKNLNVNIKAKAMGNGGFMIVEKYRESRVMARSVWWDKDTNTEKGTLLLKNMFNGKVFDYPKTVEMLIKMLEMGSCGEDENIVVDFFSGSATTAHAVMQLNAEDGGNRRFIMVQLPEKCEEESEAFKAGYKNICEIGKERIRRAGEKIKAENPDKDMDIGFRVLRIDSTNMKDVYYKPSDMTQETLLDSIDNIKNDRTDLDLLFGVMVDCGLPLDMSIETKTCDGKKYYIVNGGDYLVACFEPEISEKLVYEIANLKPTIAVFRDSSFATAKDKVNVTEIFKNITGRDDCVKVL